MLDMLGACHHVGLIFFCQLLSAGDGRNGLRVETLLCEEERKKEKENDREVLTSTQASGVKQKKHV